MDVINIVIAVGTCVGATASIGAVCVAYFQLKKTHLTNMAQEIRARDEYFNGKEFLNVRSAAAKALLEKPNDQIDDVLDFFDTVGYLVRVGALDKEMAWHTFFHWVRAYWYASKDYVAETRLKEPTVWEDFDQLYHKLMRLEAKKQKKRSLDLVPSIEEMKTFLNQEAGCAE